MTVKKGMSLFILLSLVISGVILYCSVDASSFEMLKNADKSKIAFAFLLVVGVWIMDALKLKSLTRAAGEHISLSVAFELTWINYFGSAITPMQSGGGPFQMYIMYKNGICVGKTVAITLVRTILTLMVLGSSLPLSLLVKDALPQTGLMMKGFLSYVFVFCLIAWGGFILSLVRPRLIKRFFGRIVIILNRTGILRAERVMRTIKRVNCEIDAYNQNLRDFMTTGRKYFVLGALCVVVQLGLQLSVMPCMISALGFPVNYFQCVLAQALFLFLLYFIPTPGGSGAAESGAAFVFSLFVPWSVAGMLGVAWRFITEYTGIALGVIVAAKLIGLSVVDKIMTTDDIADSAEDIAKGGKRQKDGDER